MPHESLLIGMSQLGAVLAGFIAIILAFAQREARLPATDALRTRSILHASFLAIIGSILPLILHANHLADPLVWQLSAVGGVVISLIFGADNIRFQRQMSAEDRKSAGEIQLLLGWLITLTGFALAVLVATGFGTPGLYLASLGCALLVASWNFITLAGKRWL